MQGIRLRLVLEYLDKLDKQLAAMEHVAKKKSPRDAHDAVSNAKVRVGWAAGWNACVRELRRAIKEA